MTNEYLTTGVFTVKELMNQNMATKNVLSKKTEKDVAAYLVGIGFTCLGFWLTAPISVSASLVIASTLNVIGQPERTVKDCVRAGYSDTLDAELGARRAGATEVELELSILSCDGLEFVQGCRVIAMKRNGSWIQKL